MTRSSCPRLNRGFFEKTDPDRLERWLFVGITRATRWFYLSTTDGERALFLKRFRELEQRNQMTIKRTTDGSGTPGSGTPASGRLRSAVADAAARVAADAAREAVAKTEGAGHDEENDLTDLF